MADVGVAPRSFDHAGRRHRRPAFVQRYWAFLSYSHQDEALADWLQGELEGFKVPRKLIGQGTPYGLIPARLSPVFRDRHELAAGGSLQNDIADALAASRFLVVLCSPAAARSRWVDEEIRLFKQLRPDGEVLAAILEGEPFASDLPGREEEECFPPSLRVEIDSDGKPTTERAEPIAADFREGRDGRRGGLLKIVAGMMDVGLDELVQREQHRRQRRMMALTAASLTGMLVATGLAITAIDARDSARDQRREAEGLIDFMLGDLKQRLEPIGRLDALDAVGARALAYYEKQDRDSLSDESLAQRSRALTMMGQIATARGDLDGALRRYQEAANGTGELMRREPDNAKRLYDHAQNVFWVGDAALKRGQDAEAERRMREYKALAERMVGLEPANDVYRQERKFANTNLGVLLFEQDRVDDAIALFREASAASQLLLRDNPQDSSYQLGWSETTAWLADALMRAGRLEEATAVRRRQLAFIAPLAQRPESDSHFRRQQAVAHQKLGRLLMMQGKPVEAAAEYRRAMAINDALLRIEPDSAITLGNGAVQRLEFTDVALAIGATDEAVLRNRQGCEIANRLVKRDGTVFQWRVDYRSVCLLGQARIAAQAGRLSAAEALAAEASALVTTERPPAPSPRWRMAFARAASVHGVLLAASGRRDEARTKFAAVARELGAGPVIAAHWPLAALAAQGRGDAAEGERLTSALRAAGYRDPWFDRDRQALAAAR
jgi:tetratricopeptide (TPR) repeat protein